MIEQNLKKTFISIVIAMVLKLDVLLVAMGKNLDFNMTDLNRNGIHIFLLL